MSMHWAPGFLLALSLGAPGLLLAKGALGEKVCRNDYPLHLRTVSLLHALPDAAGRVSKSLPRGVRVLKTEEKAGWCRIQTEEGDEGWVQCKILGSDWLAVQKKERTLLWYKSSGVTSYPVHLGFNPIDDKVQVGSEQEPHHWRTPEGVFYVCEKLPNSSYYRAFVLSYPNSEDALRGVQQQLISPNEGMAIQEAIARRRCPPMGTRLGGEIEIHGNDAPDRADWTWGCVAVTDAMMDEMFNQIEIGTPVIICP